ncbi:MAG: hypothetical protein CR975_04830 [Gammaproteobacteria bacterium]|nr:MAG: hypothetical protein CR975_04830 [Gammaproteobacteria bacterium]
MTRNLDITAQIADGDFTNPPLTPYNHVSPWIGLKLLAVYFALGFVLGFVNFFIILVSEWLALLLYILFGLFVPAIMLTLIATNSILETLNPKRWWETINEQVGTSNYAVLIALMVATMIISQIMGVLMEQITGNMLSLLVIMVVFIYIMFHIQSSNHYLMGFMTQKDIPDSEKADFSGYKERPRVKSQPAEAGNPILADAKTCMRSGHFEDAANLLNNLIANKAAPVIDKIHAYQMLVDVYRQLEQPAQILQTQHELLHYVTREAPHYKTKILSTVMALVKAGEFTPTPDEVHEIATLALAENQPELVLSLVGKFAKQVPEHPDVVANYLLAAKALDKQGQYEKAYRLLGGLIKKYPEHALMIEVKSEFLSVKRKLVQKQTAAKLQQPK